MVDEDKDRVEELAEGYTKQRAHKKQIKTKKMVTLPLNILWRHNRSSCFAHKTSGHRNLDTLADFSFLVFC